MQSKIRHDRHRTRMDVKGFAFFFFMGILSSISAGGDKPVAKSSTASIMTMLGELGALQQAAAEQPVVRRRGKTPVVNLPNAADFELGVESERVETTGNEDQDRDPLDELMTKYEAMQTELEESFDREEVLTDENTRLKILLTKAGSVGAGTEKSAPKATAANPKLKSISNVDVTALVGRSELVQSILNVMVRPGASKNIPLLYGSEGVGKTSLFSLIKAAVEAGNFPKVAHFQSKFSGARFIEVSPSLFPEHLAPSAVNSQLGALIADLQSGSEPKIVLIDGADILSPQVLAGLLNSVKESGNSAIVTSSESGKNSLQDINSLRGVFAPTEVADLSDDHLIDALKKNVGPELISKFGPNTGTQALISDEAVGLAVQLGPEFFPGVSKLRAAKLLLTDVVVMESRNSEGKTGTPVALKIDKASIQRLLEQREPKTVHPLMGDAFREFVEKKNAKLKSTLIGQDKIIDAMTELLVENSRGKTLKDQIKFMVVSGHLGSGMMDVGEQFAEELLGDKKRLMTIDGIGFKNEKDLWTLFGTAKGFQGSESAGGTIGEHARGNGAGKSLYLIKNPQPVLLTALSSAAEKGFYLDNQGKPVYFGKSIFLFATDKGVSKIFPPGNGIPMSDADLQRHLGRITPDSIRKMVQEPPLNNLHDDSGKWPDGFLNLVARFETTVPPKASEAIKVAINEASRRVAELKSQGYDINFPEAALKTLVESVYDQSSGIGTLQFAVQRALSDAVSALDKGEKTDIGSSGRKVSITTELDPATDIPFFSLESEKGKTRLPTQITMQKSANPLSDPAFRRRIDSLASATKEHVFGQDDAINAIANAIRSKFYESSDPKPWIGIAYGPTGNGKTETPTIMAQHLYGENSLESVLLTSFKDERMIDEYFGVGGRAGGFQRLLEKHTQGCFTLFDEMGNMPQHLKEHFMANLYDIADKGMFSTPEGKTYSLKNYQFMFASNELQEEVIHLPDDATKMARWEIVKDPEYMKKILTKRGYTQAIFGRIGSDNLFYFKPLVGDEPEKVADKLLIKRLRKMATGRGFGEVIFQDGFAKAAAEIFFTHSEGGRSLRNVADFKMSPVMTEVDSKILDFLDTLPIAANRTKHKKQTTLTVSLSDNYRGIFSYEGDFPAERKVVLKIVVQEPGKAPETFESIVKAPEKKLLSRAEKERIALHQAAIAVVNEPSKTGQRVRFVTLKPTGENLGYTLLGENQSQAKSLTREMVVYRIATILAGVEAREQVGDEEPSGIKDELIKARELAHDAVTEKGIIYKPKSLSIRATLMAMMSGTSAGSNEEAVDTVSQIEKLMADGEAKAKELVKDNWHKIKALKEALLKSSTGSVDAALVEKIRTEPVSIKDACEIAFREISTAFRDIAAAVH